MDAAFASAELLERLHAAGVPAGLVYEPKDMLDDPQFAARGSHRDGQGRAARRAGDAGVVPKLSETPGEIRWTGPALGADTDAVLTELLGLTAEQVEKLRAQGVVGGARRSGAGHVSARRERAGRPAGLPRRHRAVRQRRHGDHDAVDGARFGTTASAVSSLSMEPPMVLVCLNKTSDTQAAVLKAGAFCVNILAEGQQDLAYQFARKGDKFAGLAHDPGTHEVPVLHGTLAHLECGWRRR